MIKFIDSRNILNIEMLKNGIDHAGDVLSDFMGGYNVSLDVSTVDDVGEVLRKGAFANNDGSYDIGYYICPLVKDVSYSGYDYDFGGVVIDANIIDFLNLNYYGIADKYKNYKIMVQTLHDDTTGADYLPLSTHQGIGDLETVVTEVGPRPGKDIDYEFTSDDLGEELYNIIDGIIDSVVPSESDLYGM